MPRELSPSPLSISFTGSKSSILLEGADIHSQRPRASSTAPERISQSFSPTKTEDRIWSLTEGILLPTTREELCSCWTSNTYPLGELFCGCYLSRKFYQFSCLVLPSPLLKHDENFCLYSFFKWWMCSILIYQAEKKSFLEISPIKTEKEVWADCRTATIWFPIWKQV